MFEGGSPTTISPDGATVATNPGGGRLALWNVTRPRHPARPRLRRRLAAAPLGPDNPGPLPFGVSQADLVFSPDGHILASVSGRDQVILWNVTRPDRAIRMATLAGPRDYFAALAFSPRG